MEVRHLVSLIVVIVWLISGYKCFIAKHNRVVAGAPEITFIISSVVIFVPLFCTILEHWNTKLF